MKTINALLIFLLSTPFASLHTADDLRTPTRVQLMTGRCNIRNRTGEFFDLTKDPNEKNPLQISSLEDTPAAAARKLQSALDQFADARPVESDQQVEQSTDSNKPARKKKK
ncbi:MAG: hypothetical protein WKF77_09250 [Planctomycetaceae bacterium]